MGCAHAERSERVHGDPRARDARVRAELGPHRRLRRAPSGCRRTPASPRRPTVGTRPAGAREPDLPRQPQRAVPALTPRIGHVSAKRFADAQPVQLQQRQQRVIARRGPVPGRESARACRRAPRQRAGSGLDRGRRARGSTHTPLISGRATAVRPRRLLSTIGASLLLRPAANPILHGVTKAGDIRLQMGRSTPAPPAHYTLQMR
jgi:hypothetical protein